MHKAVTCASGSSVFFCRSRIADWSFSFQCSVCSRASSAGRDLSTSSLVPSQTLWSLRCPAPPQAIQSEIEQEENDAVKNRSTTLYFILTVGWCRRKAGNGPNLQ